MFKKLNTIFAYSLTDSQMTKIDTDKVLSVKDYAEKKGISVQAVYQAIKRGALPTIEIGGKHFIKDD